MATRGNGATTVSATMIFAHMVTTPLLALLEEMKENLFIVIRMHIFLIFESACHCRLASHCLSLGELEEYIDMASIVSQFYLYIDVRYY